MVKFKKDDRVFGIMLILIGLVFVGGASAVRSIALASDDHVRSKAVRLFSGRGTCSGEQVTSPSGHNYILTAAHCKMLMTPHNTIMVETENKAYLERAFVAEDSKSDLLLFEGIPNMPGLSIANNTTEHQHVRTFTHGSGLPTYQTEGELISIIEVKVLLGFIGINYTEACDKAKNLIINIDELSACVLSVNEMVSTAKVVPGSSGGMVVDDSGHLVGVVSASDGNFGFLVTLHDIKAFLAPY